MHLNTSKIYSIIINLCLFIWILIPSTSSDCRLVSDGQATATVSSPADDVFSNDAADDDAPAPTLDAAQPPCSSCCCAHHPSSCIALPRRQLHLLRPMVPDGVAPSGSGGESRRGSSRRGGTEGVSASAELVGTTFCLEPWTTPLVEGDWPAWRGPMRRRLQELAEGLGEVACVAAGRSPPLEQQIDLVRRDFKSVGVEAVFG